MKEMRVYLGGAPDAEFVHTLVDDEDVPILSRHRWRISKDGGYAMRHSGNHCYYMQREIMGLVIGDARHVDHINGDTLDNRRCNLRAVPGKAANNQNRRAKPGSASGFRGVTIHRQTGKWQAQCRVDGSYHYLGLFDDVLAAADAAKAFRIAHMPFAVESGVRR